MPSSQSIITEHWSLVFISKWLINPRKRNEQKTPTHRLSFLYSFGDFLLFSSTKACKITTRTQWENAANYWQEVTLFRGQQPTCDVSAIKSACVRWDELRQQLVRRQKWNFNLGLTFIKVQIFRFSNDGRKTLNSSVVEEAVNLTFYDILFLPMNSMTMRWLTGEPQQRLNS